MKTIKLHPVRRWLYFAMLLFLSSCDRFEYHPYDTKGLSATNVNAANIERIRANDNSSDTLRFILVGDTQRHYDETEDFVKAINKRTDIDFVIHGGDVSDFGLSKEYEWMYDIMKKIEVPVVTLIGNHDVIGHGKDIYLELYGDCNFSFVTHRTRFIFLNTNALEFDYSTPVPDFDYMLSFVDDTVGIENTIVAMHVPPYNIEFNNNAALMFNYIVESYKNVRFCLHAHTHKIEENDFFNNGINYYGCDDITGRSYMVFTVTPNSYAYTVETF